MLVFTSFKKYSRAVCYLVVICQEFDLKIAGDNTDVTRNPQCMGLYSFIQFKASALCFTNPLTTSRYVGIITTVANQEWLTLCEVEIYSRGISI